jgi:hypothetical protein
MDAEDIGNLIGVALVIIAYVAIGYVFIHFIVKFW